MLFIFSKLLLFLLFELFLGLLSLLGDIFFLLELLLLFISLLLFLFNILSKLRFNFNPEGILVFLHAIVLLFEFSKLKLPIFNSLIFIFLLIFPKLMLFNVPKLLLV